MKNLLLTSLFALTIIFSSFATPYDNVEANVRYSFESEFKDAADVKWTTTFDYQKAEFLLGKQKMEVFYNKMGDVIGTAATVSLDDLPVFAKRAFAKRYSDYTVQQAIHFEGMDESAYYISAENAKQTLVFKVNEFDQLTIFKCIKK